MILFLKATHRSQHKHRVYFDRGYHQHTAASIDEQNQNLFVCDVRCAREHNFSYQLYGYLERRSHAISAIFSLPKSCSRNSYTSLYCTEVYRIFYNVAILARLSETPEKLGPPLVNLASVRSLLKAEKRLGLPWALSFWGGPDP